MFVGAGPDDILRMMKNDSEFDGLFVQIQMGLVSLALMLCAASVCAMDEPTGADILNWYTEPQQMLEVEPGRRMNLVCMGSGSPVVVFEPGVGAAAGDWFRVQPAVAQYTRACAYDRAGIMFSDPGTEKPTSKDIVADLRRLLAAASIAPPYILVGQSSGGMNVRYFYYTHPDEVAGLVLIDPSHEGMSEGWRMLSPNEHTHESWAELSRAGDQKRMDCIAAARDGLLQPGTDLHESCTWQVSHELPESLRSMYLQMYATELFQRTQFNENKAVFNESKDQLYAARRAFGDLPVIVLSRSMDDGPLRDWETPRLRQARHQMWLDLHRSVADSSSKGEHRVVPDSEHNMHVSQPDAVIEAIEDIWRLVVGDAR